MKIRIHPQDNYKAVFTSSGKTFRFKIDPSKPIKSLQWPEFYDVKITDKCRGNCPYCYMDSAPNKGHYKDVVKKIQDFFGSMTPNQRPFQVAIGGGEPTEAPYFIQVLETFNELDIMPNYTTNGMFIGKLYADEIIEASGRYCGGVAISCHSHLEEYWTKAALEFFNSCARLNFHLVISDKKSIDRFFDIYNQWKGKVEYFVLLPYVAQGRAKYKPIDWEYLKKRLLELEDMSDIAFGAHFYDNLKKEPDKFKVSLYEPEIFSKFLDLKDMKLYPSSFSLEM